MLHLQTNRLRTFVLDMFLMLEMGSRTFKGVLELGGREDILFVLLSIAILPVLPSPSLLEFRVFMPR